MNSLSGAASLSSNAKMEAIDVLLGRKKYCFDHAGNVAFRILIALKTNEYIVASRAKSGKSQVILAVANDVLSTGGRFLKRQGDEDDGNKKCAKRNSSRDHVTPTDNWFPIEPKEIHEKVGNSFRDQVKLHTKSQQWRVAGRQEEAQLLKKYQERKGGEPPVTYAEILLAILDGRVKVQTGCTPAETKFRQSKQQFAPAAAFFSQQQQSPLLLSTGHHQGTVATTNMALNHQSMLGVIRDSGTRNPLAGGGRSIICPAYAVISVVPPRPRPACVIVNVEKVTRTQAEPNPITSNASIKDIPHDWRFNGNWNQSQLY